MMARHAAIWPYPSTTSKASKLRCKPLREFRISKVPVSLSGAAGLESEPLLLVDNAGRGATGGAEWGGGPKVAMDAKTNIKSRLPSRHVTEGPARAPHRSYYYAMGLTRE